MSKFQEVKEYFRELPGQLSKQPGEGRFDDIVAKLTVLSTILAGVSVAVLTASFVLNLMNIDLGLHTLITGLRLNFAPFGEVMVVPALVFGGGIAIVAVVGELVDLSEQRRLLNDDVGLTTLLFVLAWFEMGVLLNEALLGTFVVTTMIVGTAMLLRFIVKMGVGQT